MEPSDSSKSRKARSVGDIQQEVQQLAPTSGNGAELTGELSEDLKAAIKNSGLTHYAIAKRCGINPVILDRFMRDERDMRIATASKICEVLGYALAKSEPRPASEAPAVKKAVKKATKKKPSA